MTQLSKRSLLQAQSRQSAQTALSQVRSALRQKVEQSSRPSPHTHCVLVSGSAEQAAASAVIAGAQPAGSTQWVQPFSSGSDGWASSPQCDDPQVPPAGLHPRKRPPWQLQAAVDPHAAGGHQQSVVTGTQPGVWPQAHSSSPAQFAAGTRTSGPPSPSGCTMPMTAPPVGADSHAPRATNSVKMPRRGEGIFLKACKTNAYLGAFLRTL